MMIKRTVCLCSSASAPAHHLRPSKSLYFRLLFKRPPPPELPKKLRGLWGHRGAHHLFCPPMKSSEDERQADKQEEPPTAAGDESDVEELQEGVADLETQMNEVLAKYNNLDERLDVVERQLLDMARDALEATQESAESTRDGSDSDTDPEEGADKGSAREGDKAAAAASTPNTAVKDWEERKQHLVERQLRYMQAAEQATSSSEKEGLLGMVAAIGEALKKRRVPKELASQLLTPDGHIQLPPAGSGFYTLEDLDKSVVLPATSDSPQRGSSAPEQSALGNDGSSDGSGGGSEGGNSTHSSAGPSAQQMNTDAKGDTPQDADLEAGGSKGRDEEEASELRIAQARRGGRSIVQAKLHAEVQDRDKQLVKEEAEEELRRREVEQGGSMATNVPLQAVLQGQDARSSAQDAGQGRSVDRGSIPPAQRPQRAKGTEQMVGSGGGQGQGGHAGPHSGGRGDGAEADSSPDALPAVGRKGAAARQEELDLELVQFKSPWWSKARDDEVEALLQQKKGEPRTQEEIDEEERKKEEKKEKEERKDNPGLLSRKHVYEINRLQSAITEIANSGYIESVKQLREQLLIQEWDMSNRHLAKKRAISMFERYLVENNLYDEAGGFEVIGALYEDPDAYAELLVSERLRGLARCMMEECMSERRMLVYQSCNATAKDIAMRELNASGLSSIFSMKEGVWGVAQRLGGIVSRIVLPFKFW